MSSTPKVILRTAKKEDCPQLLLLIQELATFEREPNAVPVTLSEMEDAGFGSNPVWNAFVIEVDGQIVGMSLYYVCYSTWKGRRLYLEDLIITEQFRGKGFGKMLLDKTIAYAKENGYFGIVWQVLDWNTPAIDFYKKYDAHFDTDWWNVSVNW